MSMYFHYVAVISPWKKTWSFICSLPEDAMHQVRLKLVQWFWRNRPCIFAITASPWSFSFTNLNPLYRRMLHANLGWNLPIGIWRRGQNCGKIIQRQQQRQRGQTTDKFPSEKLTRGFGSDELKVNDLHVCTIWCIEINITFTPMYEKTDTTMDRVYRIKNEIFFETTHKHQRIFQVSMYWEKICQWNLTI